jgi:hypothetical protein
LWDYQRVENGKSVVGWKAGPVYGCETHYLGETRPCKRITTDSKLVCPICESGEETIFRGYVPFWDTDYQRKFVLIPEDVFDLADEIECHQTIRISRPKGSREGNIVRPDGWTLKALPPKYVNMGEIDIVPALLTVWKDEQLRAWFEEEWAKEALQQQAKKLSPEETRKKSAEVVGNNFRVKPKSLPPTVGGVLEEEYRKRGHLSNGNGQH